VRLIIKRIGVDEMNGSQSVSLTLVNPDSAQNKKKGLAYVVFGWLFFAMSLLFIPLLFGAGALFMGYQTFHKRSEWHGVILMFFAAVGIILGSLFSFFVSGTNFI
jgi:uncharacterized membrane protein YccC